MQYSSCMASCSAESIRFYRKLHKNSDMPDHLLQCSPKGDWRYVQFALVGSAAAVMGWWLYMKTWLRPTMLWNTPQRQRVIVSWKASCWSQLMSSSLLSGVEMMMATHQMTSTGKQRSCQVDHQTAAFAAYLFIYSFIRLFEHQHVLLLNFEFTSY